VAHFNFIGNSLIGNQVNFEAGSVIANHYNERENKRIFISMNNEILDTGLDKFGAVVGDNAKIGANAVLSPGTILQRGSIVKRLELIEQFKDRKKKKQ
jgi:bifunctional N-acetylglucosamine-1-phosphate-uridyltransferase/glucosamine-1-phosphate-acetyltransferase GlmU-like protein